MAATATKSPPPGGTDFASDAGAADDFRQAPDRPENSLELNEATSSSSATSAKRSVAGPSPSTAGDTRPVASTTDASSSSSPTAAATGGGTATPPAPPPAHATFSAANAAASLPDLAVSCADTSTTSALPLNPGETALLQYRKLGKKYPGITEFFMPDMAEEDLDQYGWQEALRITVDPSPWALPTEALSHKPTPDEIHKFFFKDTPPASCGDGGLFIQNGDILQQRHEVCIRQIFFHVPLSVDEQQWLQQFRQKCAACNWTIPFFLEPHVLRLVWFCKRKYPEDAINKSLEQAQLMVEWRRQVYPICDSETELRKLLDMGVMYWVGRDVSLRPLLVVRLARLPKTTSPELFKRLTIFCFEWSLRFLMVPGVVETCVVLFDVRTVPLHQFPLSALTDMVTTLTKQFPFRLHRMWIINDSFFVQTAWNIVKQFLTDVQQQKIRFYRTGYESELLKEYTPHQLEKHYGGNREIKSFYPFPMAPGPFSITAVSDRYTAFGVVWEDHCRIPVQWADGEAANEVFRAAGLPLPRPPITLRDENVAKALEVVEKATLAQRTSGIRSYKTVAQRFNTFGALRSLVGHNDVSPNAVGSPRANGMSLPHRTEALGLVGTEISKRLSTVEYTLPVNDTSATAAQGSAATAAATSAPAVSAEALQDTTERLNSKASAAMEAEPRRAASNPPSAHNSFTAARTLSKVQTPPAVPDGPTPDAQSKAEAVPATQTDKISSSSAQGSNSLNTSTLPKSAF